MNIISNNLPGATTEAIVLIVLVAQIWDDNNPHVSSAPKVRHHSPIKWAIYNWWFLLSYGKQVEKTLM